MHVLAHARSHARAVREHEKYVALATCCDLYYVHRKYEENPSIHNGTVNHARVPAAHEQDKYVS
jgi:hypothetical protein